MKIFISLLLMLHGAIHIMGFVKAFQIAKIEQLNIPISKPLGVFWLLAFILCMAAGIMYLVNSPQWSIVAIASVVISTMLILFSWSDAKFGMLPNVIILVVAIIAFATSNFHSKFENDIKEASQNSKSIENQILSETDIKDLPIPVQKYIRYTGSIGKPKVNNFGLEFEGKIRKNEQSEWMPFTCLQYSFMETPSRLFYMDARMKKLPVAGYHHFKNGKAVMDIRLLSLLKVQYAEGKEMDISETVTFFNDMCCMAPATLIDRRIKWLETDENKVNASFSNNGISISATLYFNDKGELTNFVSDDRYAASENGTMCKTPWSTPLRNYQNVNGLRLATDANVVYKYPEGEFCYGEFKVLKVEYNLSEFKSFHN